MDRFPLFKFQNMLLRYYYYRLYSYFSNGDAIPFFSTFLVIMVFACFNLVTLIDIVFSLIFRYKVVLPVFGGYGQLWYLLIIIPAYMLYHYYLKDLENHGKIIEEFKTETKRQRLISSIWVTMYFVGSIGLFILTLWLREKIRGY